MSYQQELSYLQGLLSTAQFMELQGTPDFESILEGLRDTRLEIENAPPNPYIIAAANALSKKCDNDILECLKANNT